MAKLLAAVRIVVAFVLGALVGVLGTVGTIYFYRDAVAQTFMASTPGVEELQRRLHDVEAQRNTLTRRREDVSGGLERVEKRDDEVRARWASIEGALRSQARRPEPSTRFAPGGTGAQ